MRRNPNRRSSQTATYRSRCIGLTGLHTPYVWHVTLPWDQDRWLGNKVAHRAKLTHPVTTTYSASDVTLCLFKQRRLESSACGHSFAGEGINRRGTLHRTADRRQTSLRPRARRPLRRWAWASKCKKRCLHRVFH